ncbi:class I SAM-dependent methyltransferase [Bacillus tianshenii]|uniref:class I SAM-dependent methyltransferase n=1 Tax=Sutcliffiella tianshenii TaxID=1463404 RepID=UPI001CD5760E|nr:class I SAM-dependent methyltransferase [Bacillus tianshenii]MCA1321683.1 class I SAM-dependent methyltransferase [Bacillus tianshenii]
MKKALDNAEEYNDPILYDQENESFRDDIPFLIKWANKTEGPIVDLACGTGRATIPLAEAGFEMIGVDINGNMLAEAQRKAAEHSITIQWEEQDCSDFHLPIRSRFIFTVGNSFQHFLTNEDQDMLLKSVCKHLESGGTFIFGTRFPGPGELLQPSTEEYWRSYVDRDTQQKVDVYTISEYDPIEQLQHYKTIRRMEDRETCTGITLRYTYPKEMERLLIKHGFKLVHVFQDWQETPLSEDAYQMVYVCEKVG